MRPSRPRLASNQALTLSRLSSIRSRASGRFSTTTKGVPKRCIRLIFRRPLRQLTRSQFLRVLGQVRTMWANERPPQSYEEANKRLAHARQSSQLRARLRDERRDLSSLFSRITTKLITYRLAPWRCPSSMIPVELAKELEGFFDEEDARREVLVDFLARCREEAKRVLAAKCRAALVALCRLSDRIDALSMTDLRKVRFRFSSAASISRSSHST